MARAPSASRQTGTRVRLADFRRVPPERIACAEPWHTVLGGGLVVGSTIIVYGRRGTFKTTRLMQLAASLTPGALFAAVEMGQSASYLQLVADRAGVNAGDVWIAGSSTLGELCVEVALTPAPRAVIVDSLSSLSRGADEVAALGALRRALPPRSALVVVCHVTKDGRLAGAEDLAHDCDAIVRCEPMAVTTEGEKNRYSEGTFAVEHNPFAKKAPTSS